MRKLVNIYIYRLSIKFKKYSLFKISSDAPIVPNIPILESPGPESEKPSQRRESSTQKFHNSSVTFFGP
jgi:hypothetical protein